MADVKFVKELPQRSHGSSPWVERLQPLINHPRRWAEIFEADSNEQAKYAADNLRRRLVVIPHPDHNWEFASRGSVVFAMYGGPGRKPVVRKKRRASVR